MFVFSISLFYKKLITISSSTKLNSDSGKGERWNCGTAEGKNMCN